MLKVMYSLVHSWKHKEKNSGTFERKHFSLSHLRTGRTPPFFPPTPLGKNRSGIGPGRRQPLVSQKLDCQPGIYRQMT